MNPRAKTLWTAEFRESFRMAIEAIRAHKLRSALTLLGVVVGVFSIIGVMTAIRVLQVNIEKEFSEMGANTFAVQKLPGVYFGGDEGFEKFWRRKNITLQDARNLRDRATLARYIAFEDNFWAGEVVSRFAKTPPNVRLIGGTPGSFPTKNYTVAEGRPLSESDVEGARDVCVLGHGLAQSLFPYGSPLGERIKFSGINYTVIGILESKGATLGNQENFALIPITTGMNCYGRHWRSLSVLIQAESQETYEDTIEQVRGIMRTLRKVKPGDPDDFEIFSNDTMIAQFRDFTLKVRAGVALVSSMTPAAKPSKSSASWNPKAPSWANSVGTIASSFPSASSRTPTVSATITKSRSKPLPPSNSKKPKKNSAASCAAPAVSVPAKPTTSRSIRKTCSSTPSIAWPE